MRKYRIPDLILTVVLVVGGVFAWQSSRERARLTADYERLVRLTGDLPIADPARAHILALETGEPLHFAWRIYLPPNFAMRCRSKSGLMNHMTSSSPQDVIARIRLRPNEEGNWEIYQSFAGGSTRGNIGGKELAALLKGRSDRLLVEQMGAKEVATLGPDESAVLLRLTLTEDMQAEARKTFGPFEQEQFLPDLYRFEVGQETPKPAPPPPKS